MTKAVSTAEKRPAYAVHDVSICTPQRTREATHESQEGVDILVVSVYSALVKTREESLDGCPSRQTWAGITLRRCQQLLTRIANFRTMVSILLSRAVSLMATIFEQSQT